MLIAMQELRQEVAVLRAEVVRLRAIVEPPAVLVTPEIVKELRKRTNVGILDCKRALEKCKGDVDAAEKVLHRPCR